MSESNVTPEEVDAAFRSWLRDAARPKPERVDHYGYDWAMESFNAGYRIAEQRLLAERDRLLALVKELGSEMRCWNESLIGVSLLSHELHDKKNWKPCGECLPCRARAELEGKASGERKPVEVLTTEALTLLARMVGSDTDKLLPILQWKMSHDPLDASMFRIVIDQYAEIDRLRHALDALEGKR